MARLDELLRLRAHVDAEVARARAEVALTAPRVDDETVDSAAEDLERVAEVLYIRAEHLRRHNHHAAIARRRHLAAWLLRQLGHSLPRIGRALKRDHSTILHSVRVVEGDPELLETATALLPRIVQ